MPVGLAFTGEAADYRKIVLRLAHDLADAHRQCTRIEPQAAVTAAYGFHPAQLPQPLHHLHEMVLGDPIGAGDLLDRRQPLGPDGQIEHDAQRIVGVIGQSHGCSRCSRNQSRNRRMADRPLSGLFGDTLLVYSVSVKHLLCVKCY